MMENRVAAKETHSSGETPGVGVYLCSQCHFAIVVVKDNFVLPTCPCCENNFFEKSDDTGFDE